MSRFLVDAQLPPSLADWLTLRGHESTHVTRIGLGAASDTSIWQHALRDNVILVTKDDDFVQRSTLTDAAPIIVWVRLGNCRNTALISAFETALPAIESAIAAGDRIIELV